MGSITQVAPATQPTPKPDGAASQVPFTRGSYEAHEAGPTWQGPLTTNAQPIIVDNIPSFGFLRDVVIDIQAVASGNSATVAFKEDAPYSVIQEVSLQDPNGSPLLQMSGFDLMLANKFGGYDFDADPTRDPAYLATTGGGGSGGSFGFLLRIPVEIVSRYAFGALPNMNAASGLVLKITLAPSTDVYSTAPTAQPTVTVLTTIESWAMPEPMDYRGRPVMQTPPEMGTVQFWTKNVYNVLSGDNTIQLRRVGNLIRNLVFIYRVSGARNNANMPATYRLLLDQRPYFEEYPRLRRSLMAERYGYDGLTKIDTGVLVFDWTHDADGHPGGELRDLYVPTNGASRLELRGNFGSAGTLTVLTNDVVPAAMVAP